MYPLFGDGIFTQDGTSWKHSRDMIRPFFVHKQYEELEIFQDAVDDFLSILPQQGVIDLQPMFFSLTLDITMAYLFGISVKLLRETGCDSQNMFASAFNTAQDCLAKRMRAPNFYWLIGGARFKQACSDVHRFADQIIEQSVQSNQRFGLNTLTRTALKCIPTRRNVPLSEKGRGTSSADRPHSPLTTFFYVKELAR